MRELAWRWSPDIRQIDLDVNRTYRDHIMFRERYNSKQQELFNVLSAYSVYNLEIGYCQGMSQIAALLLMYLDEEEAFWALSVLLSDKKFNMHGESLKPNKLGVLYQWKWFILSNWQLEKHIEFCYRPIVKIVKSNSFFKVHN